MVGGPEILDKVLGCPVPVVHTPQSPTEGSSAYGKKSKFNTNVKDPDRSSSDFSEDSSDETDAF